MTRPPRAPWLTLASSEFIKEHACSPTLREARQRLIGSLGFDTMRVEPVIVEMRSRTRIDYAEHLQVTCTAGDERVTLSLSPKLARRLTADRLCKRLCADFDRQFTW